MKQDITHNRELCACAQQLLCVNITDRSGDRGTGSVEEEGEGERERERERERGVRMHAGGMQWLHVTTTQAAPAAAAEAAPLRDVG